MKKSILQAVFLAVISLISVQALADTMMLKSGQSVEGKITDKGKDFIKIDQGVGLSVTYFMDEIVSINGQNIPQPPVAVPFFQRPILNPVAMKADTPSVIQPTAISKVDNVPLESPEDTSKISLPGFKRWVNDYAGILPVEYVQEMNSLINELEEKTSAEIAVVTIPSVAPYTEFEYAQMLFDKWKIGKKGKDNGVIVLLAVREHRWRIQTGYGVEGILTDAVSSRIGRNKMVPYFKQGEYAQGLYSGVLAIARLISKDSGVSLNGLRGVRLARPHQKVSPVFYFFAFFFFLLWNLPWPIFIGLPFTLIFGFAFYQTSPILGLLVIAGYLGSMFFRYFIWANSTNINKGSFGQSLVRGMQGSGSQGRWYGSGGSFGGGSSGGGGGGGSSGGGGAGGGF